ncbi:MAG TPA: TolC family protein, partial [Marinilabiliaceae bacterium]|nr:TolC family protein [Marinilabiliaceae bacterium]
YIIILLYMLGLSQLSWTQTLDDYFTQAAENNAGLQASYKAYEAALQQVPQVSSLSDPQFSLGFYISPNGDQVIQENLKLTLTQMFPWFGTLKAQGDAAALRAEAKFHEFIDKRNQLYYQVTAAYHPLLELDYFIQVEKENIDLLTRYKFIATKKFENGDGSMVDILRTDILLKEAETNHQILIEKEKPLISQFNQLLNREKEEEVVLPKSLNLDKREVAIRQDSLIGNHPLLEALTLQVEANKASERAAQKRGLPQIGVGVEYEILKNQDDMIMPMVTLSIPIFRKKYKGAVKEAQLMQESYSLQKQEVTSSLHSTYEMVWFEIQEQKQLLSLYINQEAEAEKSLNLLFSSYANSGRAFEEVLRMQQQLLSYQKLKIEASTQYDILSAELDYLIAKTR